MITIGEFELDVVALEIDPRGDREILTHHVTLQLGERKLEGVFNRQSFEKVGRAPNSENHSLLKFRVVKDLGINVVVYDQSGKADEATLRYEEKDKFGGIKIFRTERQIVVYATSKEKWRKLSDIDKSIFLYGDPPDRMRMIEPRHATPEDVRELRDLIESMPIQVRVDE